MRFELEVLEKQLEQESFDKIGTASPVKEKPIKQSSLGNANFIEPVSQIIAVTALSMIAYRIVDHWLADKEQGVLIDLTKDPTLISRVAGVPNGLVHLIDKSGNAKMMKYDYNKSNDLKDVLLKFLGDSKKEEA